MEFSIRDGGKKNSAQAGQGIVEFLLVLCVTVLIVLGGIYQLNTAFKAWANEYFGNYIACLLETGELPSMGGVDTTGGVCSRYFKEFSLKEGRPLLTQLTPSSGGSGSGGTGESRSGKAGGSRESGSQGSGGYGSHTPIRGWGASGRNAGAGSGGKLGSIKKDSSANTGNTSAQGYSPYSDVNRKLDTRTKERLDTKFALEKEEENKQKRRSVAAAGPKSGEGNAKGRMIIQRKDLKKDQQQSDGEGFTFGNFIRLLIIAAIIIALVFLIGGQMMQIGKSME